MVVRFRKTNRTDQNLFGEPRYCLCKVGKFTTFEELGRAFEVFLSVGEIGTGPLHVQESLQTLVSIGFLLLRWQEDSCFAK